MLAGIGVTLLRNGLAMRRRNVLQIAETALAAATPTPAPATVAPGQSVAGAAGRPMVSTFARQQRGAGRIPGKGTTLALAHPVDEIGDVPGHLHTHTNIHTTTDPVTTTTTTRPTIRITTSTNT